MSFDYLSEYDPTDRTAWFTLPIKVPKGWGPPRLLMRHAGDTNTPYVEAMAERNVKRSGGFGVGTSAVMSALDDGLQADRDLLPLHACDGWENIPSRDESGEVTKTDFTREKCVEFFAKLPPWILRRVSSFTGFETNFLPDTTPDAQEIREHAKN